MKKDGFFYKVILGVCIAVCVAGLLGGMNIVRDRIEDWLGPDKGSESITSEAMEGSESITSESLEESEILEEGEKE